MNNANTPSRKPGRPRNEATDQTILRTARELIMENGIQSFSMDGLAARSGVSKPTIYRRWANKEALISDVLGRASAPPPIPDTGSVLDDIRLLLEQMLRQFGESFGINGQPVHKLLAALLDSRSLLEQYKTNFIIPRRKAYEEILVKGIQRGEIRAEVNLESLIDLISGAYFYCMVFKPENVTSGVWLEDAFVLLSRGIVNPL